MRVVTHCRSSVLRWTGRPIPALRVVLLIAIAAGGTAAAERDLIQADARLQKPLTVRVSRMPLAELLRRVSDEAGVRLNAPDEEVVDQRLDLFTHGTPVTAAEVLTAVSRMLNAECPPKGYLWERSGARPHFRYTLSRDVASRQWERQRAAEAETRLPRLLRERFAALGREPFRSESAAPLELASMRKLLPALTEAQLARLCAERHLILTVADCTPAQKELLGQLVDELVAYQLRRWPEATWAALAKEGALDKDRHGESDLEVVLQGNAPRYLVRVGVGGPASLGQSSDLCPVVDTEALSGSGTGTRPPVPPGLAGRPEPVFALPPRTHWLMGDVLADIAARAKINLVADHYTHRWTKLSRYTGARSLSAWLTAIRDECGFEPAREGSFLRLRNRAWWLDRQREIPTRLLTRWHGMLKGCNADRLQVLVEIARRVPFSPHPRVIGDRMEVLDASPEIARTVNQNGPRTVLSLTHIVAIRQLELLLYDRLTPEQQRAVLGPGLRLGWAETPADWQQVFAAGARPGAEEGVRSLTLFMRYEGDRLQIDRDFPALSIRDTLEAFLPDDPADDPRHLIGRPLPELEIEEPSGRTTPFRPRGPALLYIAPTWSRPLVTSQEPFTDLKALAEMTSPRVHVLGTGATAAELRDWWPARGLNLSPLALPPTSARRLGARYLPLAIGVDGAGRVTGVKEGYSAGDEEEWRRQLGQAGG